MIPEQTTLDLGLGYRDLNQPKRANPKALARRNDPATSKAAALEIIDHLSDLQAQTLDLVRLHPGRTVSELADLGNIRDPRKINRRLPELLKMGCVRRKLDGERCSITGRTAGRWWAVEA